MSPLGRPENSPRIALQQSQRHTQPSFENDSYVASQKFSLSGIVWEDIGCFCPCHRRGAPRWIWSKKSQTPTEWFTSQSRGHTFLRAGLYQRNTPYNLLCTVRARGAQAERGRLLESKDIGSLRTSLASTFQPAPPWCCRRSMHRQVAMGVQAERCLQVMCKGSQCHNNCVGSMATLNIKLYTKYAISPAAESHYWPKIGCKPILKSFVSATKLAILSTNPTSNWLKTNLQSLVISISLALQNIHLTFLLSLISYSNSFASLIHWTYAMRLPFFYYLCLSLVSCSLVCSSKETPATRFILCPTLPAAKCRPSLNVLRYF
jgi:hypothetical protein